MSVYPYSVLCNLEYYFACRVATLRRTYDKIEGKPFRLSNSIVFNTETFFFLFILDER